MNLDLSITSGKTSELGERGSFFSDPEGHVLTAKLPLHTRATPDGMNLWFTPLLASPATNLARSFAQIPDAPNVGTPRFGGSVVGSTVRLALMALGVCAILKATA